MLESLQTIAVSLPYILTGSLVTVSIVLASLSLGFVCGIPLALMQVYGNAATRWFVRFYVWFFRGTPILVLLFLFFFGLPQILGIDISAFTASCLVLGMTSGAYQSQIFRGSILSLPAGQRRAALALGMNGAQTTACVVLPQALRLSIPAWTNEYSILLKDSALVFALGGAQDIMARTHFVASRTYEHIPMYLLAGLIYYIITLIGLKALRKLEKRVAIPGYAT